LIDSIRRNPDNNFLINLKKYLELRVSELNSQWPKVTDVEEIKRMQGRSLEIAEFLKALERVPVENKYDGAYGD
jgi:hypothetical protein